MPDLEEMLRHRQDQLRGRPRDWIDDFADWYCYSVDWGELLIAALALSSSAILLVIVAAAWRAAVHG